MSWCWCCLHRFWDEIRRQFGAHLSELFVPSIFQSRKFFVDEYTWACDLQRVHSGWTTTAVLKRTFRKNLDSANFTVVQNPSRDIWCITSSHKLKEFTEYCYVLTTCCFPYAWRFFKHILGIPQEIQNFKTSQNTLLKFIFQVKNLHIHSSNM